MDDIVTWAAYLLIISAVGIVTLIRKVMEQAAAGKDGKNLGYAVITEEQGRFKPITFIVKMSAERRVDMVLVMVYRESRGDGVKRQRFLKQFRDKEASDHLRLNRDIVGVSGATMSSRALAIGVKKVLAVLEMRYPSKKAAP